MKKIRIIPSVLLALISPTWATGGLSFELQEGDTISEWIWENVNHEDPVYRGIYPDLVAEVLEHNKLDDEEAKALPTGTMIQIPPHLEALFRAKTKDLESKEPTEAATPVSGEKSTTTFLGPRPSLLIGTFLFQESEFKTTGSRVNLGRNLQPIIGADLNVSWEMPSGRVESDTRLLLTKYLDTDDNLPLEFSLREQVRGSQLAFFGFTPFATLKFEQSAFFSGNKSSPDVSKLKVLLAGIGVSYSLSLQGYNLNLMGQLARSLNASTDASGVDDLAGNRVSYGVKYLLPKNYFVELHGQHYHLEKDDSSYEGQKFFSLLGKDL